MTALEVLGALGGFGGVGALITALATWRRSGRIMDDTRQLAPGDGAGGDTVADAVRQLVAGYVDHTETISSHTATMDRLTRDVAHLGRQIGQVSADAAVTHQILNARITDTTAPPSEGTGAPSN